LYKDIRGKIDNFKLPKKNSNKKKEKRDNNKIVNWPSKTGKLRQCGLR